MAVLEPVRARLSQYTKRITPRRVALLLSPLVLGGFFLVRLQYLPSGGDALGYYILTETAQRLGFLADLGGIRTYGYPAFLYVLSFVSTLDIPRFMLTAGLAQFAIYLALVAWLLRVVSDLPVAWRSGMYVALLLNPIVLTLITDVLTESVTICIALAMTAILLHIRRRPEQWLLLSIAGSILAAYALMVRPANMILFASWHIAALLPIVFAIFGREMLAFLRAATYIIVVSATTFLIFLPQLHYNYTSWEQISIFPACRIDQLQYALGIYVSKYETVMTGPAAAVGSMYLNPLAGGPLPYPSWLWYLQNPIRGLGSMALHVFNVFDYTTPFTYIYESNPWYRYPLGALIWTLTAAGVWRFFNLAYAYVPSIFESNRRHDSAAALFILVLVVLTTAMNSIIQVENRFGILPLLILTTMGAASLIDQRSRSFQPLPSVLIVIFVTCCLALSTEVETWHSTVLPEELNIESAKHPNVEGVKNCVFLKSDMTQARAD